MATQFNEAAARVGILLPPEADLGWRLRARTLAMAVVEAGFRAEVGITGMAPDGPMDAAIAAPFRGIPGVGLRRLVWQRVPGAIARNIHGPALVPADLDWVMLPFDWGWHFTDCAAWLLCADPMLGYVPAVRPTLVYCRGLPMRYDPACCVFDDAARAGMEASFSCWRQAAAVFAADLTVATDLADYAGIRRPRIHLVGPTLPPPAPLPGPRGGALLVWLTAGMSADEDATLGLALALVRAERPDLRVLVSGPGLHQPGPHQGQRLSQVPGALAVPVRNEPELLALLGQAAAIWYTGCTAFEAEPAWLAACGPGRLVAQDLPELAAGLACWGGRLYACPADDVGGMAAAVLAALKPGPRGCPPVPVGDARLVALLKETLAYVVV